MLLSHHGREKNALKGNSINSHFTLILSGSGAIFYSSTEVKNSIQSMSIVATDSNIITKDLKYVFVLVQKWIKLASESLAMFL